MRAGSPILFDIALYDAVGNGLSYASQAAFTAAGWSLTWIDMATGVAVSPSLTWTIAPVAGVTGRHVVQVASLPANEIYARITPPANYSYVTMPSVVWTGESTDTDLIYARVTSVYGSASSTNPSAITLPSVVEGDAYLATISPVTAYLTRLGWTDLTGASLQGTIRLSSDVGTGTALADLVTGAPTSAQGQIRINGSDATKIDLLWTAFPSGMALTSGQRTTGGYTANVTIEATKSSAQLSVVYRASLNVLAKDAYP